MRKIRYIAALALLAMVASAMFGANHSVAQTGNLFIRVAHVTPTIAAQDVYVDGSKVLTAVAYKQVSDYLSIAAGHHVIKVTDTGTTSGASMDADFAAGKHLTIFAYPAIAGPVGGPPQYKPGLVQVEDDFVPPPAGKARISVSHFSPDTDDLISVVVSGTSGSALVFAKQATFGHTTATTDADAGTYSVQVSNGQGNIITSTVTLAEGKDYNLAVIGLTKAAPAAEVLPVVANVGGSNAATPTVAAAAPTATAAITATATTALTPTATLTPAATIALTATATAALTPPSAPTALPPAPTPTAVVAAPTATAVKVVPTATHTPAPKPTAAPTTPGLPRTGSSSFDPFWLLVAAAVAIGAGLASARRARVHPDQR